MAAFPHSSRSLNVIHHSLPPVESFPWPGFHPRFLWSGSAWGNLLPILMYCKHTYGNRSERQREFQNVQLVLKIVLFLLAYHLLSLRLQLHTSGESDPNHLTEHHVLPVKATDFTTHSFWTPATKAWPKGSPGYLASKLKSVRLHLKKKPVFQEIWKSKLESPWMFYPFRRA